MKGNRPTVVNKANTVRNQPVKEAALANGRCCFDCSLVRRNQATAVKADTARECPTKEATTSGAKRRNRAGLSVE